MSNYYEYKDIKVMIAHRLMAMEGWKVYGYSPDQSDIMVDYHHYANWGGIAEKNGYVLCVSVYGASESQEIREYMGTNDPIDPKIQRRIESLKEITVERGASIDEERTAKEKLKNLEEKKELISDERKQYQVIGHIPAHMAHPPRCSWHIEKDGLIIAKGTGLLKFSELTDKENYKIQTEDQIREQISQLYGNKEKLDESVFKRLKEQERIMDLKNKFDVLIRKFDSTCGGLLGEGDLEQYERKIVTKYKKEIKAVETKIGTIQEGQTFIVKGNFTNGVSKGMVYRIHKDSERSYYHAYRLNGKLTKELHGMATSSNYWALIDDSFLKWIEKGTISWCELVEKKVPYEVEKVVKKARCKPKRKKSNLESEDHDTLKRIEYAITESRHTKTGERIWLVKIITSLSKLEFKEIERKYGAINGYYSSYTHSFIFKYDPTQELKTLS